MHSLASNQNPSRRHGFRSEQDTTLFFSSIKIKCKIEWNKKVKRYKYPKGKAPCSGLNLNRISAVKVACQLQVRLEDFCRGECKKWNIFFLVLFFSSFNPITFLCLFLSPLLFLKFFSYLFSDLHSFLFKYCFCLVSHLCFLFVSLQVPIFCIFIVFHLFPFPLLLPKISLQFLLFISPS